MLKALGCSFLGLQDGATAVFLAAQEGHENVLSQLLTCKADVDAIRKVTIFMTKTLVVLHVCIRDKVQLHGFSVLVC